MLKLDPELLPGPMRPFAEDIAYRMQIPIEYLAVPLLVGLAGVTGRRVLFMPKQFDPWKKALNLWGGIVAASGTMKSSAIGSVVGILQAIDAAAAEDYKRELAEYEQEMQEYRANGLPGEPPEKPTCRRILVNDATVPKLQMLFAENPMGLLLERDEIAGWFASLDSVGRETDRPFYLECWDGSLGFTVDRVQRGTTRASTVCLSLLGGIQEGPLRKYVYQAVTGGAGDDGLVQRLQLVVFPDRPTTYTYVDRLPDVEAENAVTELFVRMAQMSPETPRILRFDIDAQAHFRWWLTKLEARIRREPMPEYFRSHLSKYRGLMPTIAGLLHLAENPASNTVSLFDAYRAERWCEFLESHAGRMYSAGSPRSMASLFAEKILSGALDNPFTVRQVLKKGWGGLNDARLVLPVLKELEDAGWVRREAVPTTDQGGRPSERYRINPKVLAKEKSTKETPRRIS